MSSTYAVCSRPEPGGTATAHGCADRGHNLVPGTRRPKATRTTTGSTTATGAWGDGAYLTAEGRGVTPDPDTLAEQESRLHAWSSAAAASVMQSVLAN